MSRVVSSDREGRQWKRSHLSCDPPCCSERGGGGGPGAVLEGRCSAEDFLANVQPLFSEGNC